MTWINLLWQDLLRRMSSDFFADPVAGCKRELQHQNSLRLSRHRSYPLLLNHKTLSRIFLADSVFLKGGMKAVIWTDVFQCIIMLGGILAMLVKVSFFENLILPRSYRSSSRGCDVIWMNDRCHNKSSCVVEFNVLWHVESQTCKQWVCGAITKKVFVGLDFETSIRQ